MRKAFLVFGPEGSGTRMLAKSFISVGCWGDSTHEQSLDIQDLQQAPDLIVWRRSVPHAGQWHVFGIVEEVRQAGYEVQTLVIVRDADCTIRSDSTGPPSRTDKRERRRRALDLCITTLHQMNADPIIVNYELFVEFPDVRRYLFALLGFPAPKMDYYNANEKYDSGRWGPRDPT